VLETPEEIEGLRRLLDRSAAGAGPHMRDIISEERRLPAERVCEKLQGMRLLVIATVTADGRPVSGPADGYFLHGSFHFSLGSVAVRARHLAARPAITATYLPGTDLSVTVHGHADLFDIHADTVRARELRRAMLDHYVPLQGPDFEKWLDQVDGIGVRIAADKMFTFSADT
jgi:hypothetical protein